MAKCKYSRFNNIKETSAKKSPVDFDDDSHLEMKQIENTRNMCNSIDSFLYYTPIYVFIILYFLYCIGYFKG